MEIYTAMIFGFILSLPALVNVDYSLRIIVLFVQLILFLLSEKISTLQKTTFQTRFAILFISLASLILGSNLLGLISGRNENLIFALSDFAPLLVFLMFPICTPITIIFILLITNTSALILNLIKLSLLTSDYWALSYIFELYRISDNFTVEYWRFTGLVGQAGQAGLHALLSIICILLVRNHIADRWLYLCITLAIINMLFSASRISILSAFLVVFVYVIIKKSLKLKLLFITAAMFVFACAILLFSSFMTSDFIAQRFYDLDTGGYRFDLLKASFAYAAETFPFGYGSQKEYLDANGKIGISDLSLRYPDGYVSLLLIRYGYLGFIIYTGIFAYLVVKKLRSSQYFYSPIYAIIYFISFVDPLFIYPVNVALMSIIMKGPRLNARFN